MADEPTKEPKEPTTDAPDSEPFQTHRDAADDSDVAREARKLATQVVTALAIAVTDKDIRMLLVELTKQRAIKILDTYSDKNLDEMSLTLIGTSPGQVTVMRRWLQAIVVPEIIDAYHIAFDSGIIGKTDVSVAGSEEKQS